jgi:hypothetical protein
MSASGQPPELTPSARLGRVGTVRRPAAHGQGRGEQGEAGSRVTPDLRRACGKDDAGHPRPYLSPTERHTDFRAWGHTRQTAEIEHETGLGARAQDGSHGRPTRAPPRGPLRLGRPLHGRRLGHVLVIAPSCRFAALAAGARPRVVPGRERQRHGHDGRVCSLRTALGHDHALLRSSRRRVVPHGDARSSRAVRLELDDHVEPERLRVGQRLMDRLLQRPAGVLCAGTGLGRRPCELCRGGCVRTQRGREDERPAAHRLCSPNHSELHERSR